MKEKLKEIDVTDGLTDEQFNELKELAAEDDEKDITTPEEFNKVTKRWRTK